MVPDPLLTRLQALADDFSCRYWRCAAVVSPQEHEAKARADYEHSPSATASRRLKEAPGKYAVIFHGPQAPDWRGQLPGSRPIEAAAAFTPEGVETMADHTIRKFFIGVILEREFHEILESAQVKGALNSPIVDPHTDRQDVDDVLTWLKDAMVSHAIPKDDSAA